MKAIFSLLFVFALPFSANSQSFPTAESFKTYISGYAHPEFFSHNETALSARLKLLDMAPAEAIVQIATFTFDYGLAVREISQHVCAATRRGVKVQISIDSKSGDRLNAEDPFDLSSTAVATSDFKATERLMVAMAACGAEVFVHNSFTDYIQYKNTRLPNILEAQSHGTGGVVSLANLGNRLYDLKEKIGKEIDTNLSINGALGASSFKILQSMLDIFIAYAELETNPEGARNKIRALYDNILNDPLLTAKNARALRAALPTIVRHVQRYPDLRDVYGQIRRFNRLNHRKLFMVRLKTGEGCALFGGRNLGDHYLKFIANKSGFYDGDVIYCQTTNEANSVLERASLSFSSLLRSEADPFLPSGALTQADQNIVRRVKPDSSVPAISALSENWMDLLPVHGDVNLDQGTNWRLLVSDWSRDKDDDEVQTRLLGLIKNEKSEIYIETAYAEFNADLRQAIDEALRRGVRFKLVTNSFADSDGHSKFIRILMAPWQAQILQKYPNQAQILISSKESGHMTHFKGAGFRCQPQSNGQVLRSFIVGSHNFHPRSGRSDKEHALTWDEVRQDQSCASDEEDLISARERFYSNAAASTNGHPSLSPYESFFRELDDVAKSPASDRATIILAETLKAVVYADVQGNLRHPDKVRALLEFLDQSGIRDLLGLLL